MENVFVADYGNDRIQKFSPDGQFIGAWGSHGIAPGEFDGPEDVAIDSQGNVYVADSVNDRIQVFREFNSASNNKKTAVSSLYYPLMCSVADYLSFTGTAELKVNIQSR